MKRYIGVMTSVLVGMILSASIVSAQAFPAAPTFNYDASGNITQVKANTPIKLTGLSTGLCLTLSASNILTTTSCGSGGGSSFASTTPWTLGSILVANPVGANTIASSSLDLPNSALQNSSIVVNGTTFNLGDTHTITAASSTLLANNNTFSGNNIFSASTTMQAQLNLQGASSTLFSTSNLWDSALSSGNCVQAGAGGILTTISGACGTSGGITALGNYATTTGTAISFSTTTATVNGVTYGLNIVPSANAILFTPTISGTLNNAGLTNSSIVVNGTTFNLGDSKTVTAASSTLLTDSNTWTKLQSFSNATSTLFTCTTCWVGTLGAAMNGGGFQINNIAAPTSGGDAANKTYVDNAIAGVNPAVAVQAATVAAGDTSALTYSNGVSGVGATFTGSNNTALTIDGYTFTALGQRLLIKNDTQSANPGSYNGIYYVTQIQTAILPPILTRALDYDMPSDMNNTGAIPVVNGTVNGSTSWVLTSQVTTVGTSVLTYTQFSVNPSTIFTTAGTGLSGTGSNTVSLNLGANNVWTASTTMQQQLNLQGASSTLFSTGTFWNTGLTSALASFDANHKETAYAGSSGVCTNQFPTSLSALGVLGTCTSVADAFFTGQLGLSHGGTNSSLTGASGLVAMNSGNTALSIPSTSYMLSSTLLTAPNASTTNLTVATSLQIPSAANPEPTVKAYCSQSTNSPYQIQCGNNAGGTSVYDSRTGISFYISSTTAMTASTTEVVAVPTGFTATSGQCTAQPAGATAEIEWYYANPTAYTSVTATYWNASSTPGQNAISSNNTPATNATSTLIVGNFTGSPTSVACNLFGAVTGI